MGHLSRGGYSGRPLLEDRPWGRRDADACCAAAAWESAGLATGRSVGLDSLSTQSVRPPRRSQARQPRRWHVSDSRNEEQGCPQFSKLTHGLAVGLTVVVFPLIWVGGLVTTYDAGMAVPDWPTTYGWNMFAYPASTWLFGPFDLMVEHSHRLLASLSGMIAIGLVVAAWKLDRRPWFRWWAVGLLLLVIAQGVLGGVRVLLDERLVAKIHGCVGPAFFALAAATGVLTSRWWFAPAAGMEGAGRRVGKAVAIVVSGLCALSYLQLVLGAQLRHITGWMSHRSFRGLVHAHLAMAGLLLMGVLVAAIMVWWKPTIPRVRRWVMGLCLLVVLQIVLGCATWVVNYALPWSELNKTLAGYTIQAKGFVESLVVTAHMATGSLIVAFAAVASVRAWRFRWVVKQGRVQ
ncbi:MAG: cytochrome oxidase assembly protein [Planctomycetota bacterium]|nr:MAG: cytochrome oxidase assembly protein [Planctomycetota bacterium]